MRVDWCVSSWFRIKNTHSLTHGGCVCVCCDARIAPPFIHGGNRCESTLSRVVLFCLASTHTALVSSPSLTVLRLSRYVSIYGTLRHD